MKIFSAKASQQQYSKSMSNNRITTQSYTIKRLRDSGYIVDRLDSITYQEDDKRKWSIMVDNGVSSIILTCFKDSSIQLYDGARFLNPNLRLDTDSVEVLIDYFNERGIVNKHWNYGKPKSEAA